MILILYNIRMYAVAREFDFTSIDAIFCDVDGTMVPHGEQLPPSDLISAIGRVASKAHFIPVTGRSLQDGADFLNALPVDIAIAAGGAIELRRFPDYDDGLISAKVTPTLMRGNMLRFLLEEDGELDSHIAIEEVSERLRHGECESLFIRSVDQEEAQRLAAQINTRLGDRLYAAPVVSQNGLSYDVHINRDQASKVYAMEHVIIDDKRLVDLDRSIMIADGPNDLPAMQAVGYSVAMGNAHEDLKAAADEVIGAQEEDGLLDFLARI